jgi:hypothetical protein
MRRHRPPCRDSLLRPTALEMRQPATPRSLSCAGLQIQHGIKRGVTMLCTLREDFEMEMDGGRGHQANKLLRMRRRRSPCCRQPAALGRKCPPAGVVFSSSASTRERIHKDRQCGAGGARRPPGPILPGPAPVTPMRSLVSARQTKLRCRGKRIGPPACRVAAAVQWRRVGVVARLWRTSSSRCGGTGVGGQRRRAVLGLSGPGEGETTGGRRRHWGAITPDTALARPTLPLLVFLAAAEGGWVGWRRETGGALHAAQDCGHHTSSLAAVATARRRYGNNHQPPVLLPIRRTSSHGLCGRARAVIIPGRAGRTRCGPRAGSNVYSMEPQATYEAVIYINWNAGKLVLV